MTQTGLDRICDLVKHRPQLGPDAEREKLLAGEVREGNVALYRDEPLLLTQVPPLPEDRTTTKMEVRDRDPSR